MNQVLPSSITLPAPVKLNLFLHITGRLDSGYHLLQTIFQLLDYGDQITIDTKPDQLEQANKNGIQFHCNLPELATSDNLVVKAANILQSHADKPVGAKIYLDKRTAAGGGLGGGSSDAATTLLGLNKLWQLGLSVEELAQIGQQLGADVPVFVNGYSAWAEGIGEKLQALDLPELYYLVVSPNCAVSTAEIFTHPELTRDSTAITVAAFFDQGGHNDCQPLVEKLYPDVKAVVDWLQQHAPKESTTLMTGTGASVFTTFTSESAANQLLEQCPWRGFVAKGINRSPVHDILAKL